MGTFSAAETNRNKSSWYGDIGNFLTSSFPWLSRGGLWIYGSYSGVFAFTSSYGNENTGIAYRIVLTPTK